ncbi:MULTISPECIES: betaine/proline/choline family ABC transporter ATP-binding protein [unclassified Streptomyces]|uniref:Betaine/proline/choline family ABC transporter ATP-binding protein n=2 Tax=Streptomyces TaxID=1883 RepID=A0ABU2R9I6_9ACTN|nr:MULTISPECIES: betaine/proline/choline family ABC transporter ATP-binding protein [unclassified Streptomyces]EFL04012.1 D-methionine ABC transporter, ATP-binding protein [Streptomyces sp. SPB78]MDT0412921.1 betaine/proline/choline family ABC transporter ATP-binding protein [Streptomyces sp. DSM 41979]MYQ59129.1 betaine/proline/choline family ABC transporter ATP-binding protein [Streptomyces sp. SID4926]MYR30265.1 betaine/proline/choline family ABC transporter ATP-binding protein [Streptomyces
MIRFEGVGKRYADGTVAVHDLSLDVAEGQLVTLVGPSGCGKTTTMMMVNRLVEPTSGRIEVDGEDIAHVDPVALRRRIGYVIQQVGLFPHRTVLDNTATVLSLLGTKRGRARERARELLDLVGLDPETFGPRYPHQLSGGQRQRVGVARALAADPPVLLMDEPFGAVDPVVRERLQNQFVDLQRRLRKTVLFVTHDIEEAVRLGDRMAVYGPGRIEQFDTPQTVLGRPATPYVAEFVGTDRGLKRLSVTEIRPEDLEEPPLVRRSEPAARAAERLRAEGARWAVVLDEAGELHGWVGVDELGGGGDRAVGELAHRMNAWVPVGAPLKQAFGEMLQHDAGWVAVLDGARFLGVLTPGKLHEALRRSVDADARGVRRGDVDFESVADA